MSSGGGQRLHSQPEGLQPVLRILPRKPGAHHRQGGYFSEERRWPPLRVSRASANRTTGAEESCTTGPKPWAAWQVESRPFGSGRGQCKSKLSGVRFF